MKKRLIALLTSLTLAVGGGGLPAGRVLGETVTPAALAGESAETDVSMGAAGTAEQTGTMGAAGTTEPGPVDLSKALPEFQGMTWDPAQNAYRYTDPAGTVVWYSPEDPEFERRIFGPGEEEAQTRTDGLGFGSFDTSRSATTNSTTSPFTQQTYTYAVGLTGTTILDGVDVSEFNGTINWGALKSAGVDFAIVRVAARLSASGAMKADPYWQANIQGALNAGIKVGAYVFSQAITEAEAVEEANYGMNLLGSFRTSMELPLYIDYEYANGAGRLKNANLSADAHQAICNAFCRTVKAGGYKPGIYANVTMLSSEMRPASCEEGTTYWLARYSNTAGYSGAYNIWQYSSRAQITGNGSSYIDVNFWFTGSSTASSSTKTDTDTGTDGNGLTLNVGKKSINVSEDGYDRGATTVTAKFESGSSAITWSIVKMTDWEGDELNTDWYNTVAVVSFDEKKATVEGVSPGIVTLRATVKNNTSVYKDVEIKVCGKLERAEVAEEDITYSGGKIKPEFTVFFGTHELDLGTHYTVKYKRNKNVGTAKAVIKGKGIYSGKVTTEFEIQPTDFSTSDDVRLSTIKTQRLADGGIQPKLTVKIRKTVLTEGKDYKLRYLDEDGDLISTIKKPGTYIPVVIEAKSRNFTGQVEGEEFDVKKA